jgi:hypothetical protein
MSKTNYLLQSDGNLKEGEESNLDDLDIESSLDSGQDDKTTYQGTVSGVDAEDGIVISKPKLAMVSALLDTIKESQDKITQLLAGSLDTDEISRISIGQTKANNNLHNLESKDEGRIIEGVFDGENMIGPDGKQYSVPANYASKSKLVEGDILKLTITPKGTFVYKQIGPIERSRVFGGLHQGENGSFVVEADGKEWKVLTASVTYYKGGDGDEIVILVPKVGESKWAAVENIVRKSV